MIRKRISTFYFDRPCTEVWEAVVSGKGCEGFTYSPISDDEYMESRSRAVAEGKVYARVTDMSPGKSCAYELNAPKFDVYWSSLFSTVGDNECKMVMTEEYVFHPDAIMQYILALLFLRQGRQHRAFREAIESRLK